MSEEAIDTTSIPAWWEWYNSEDNPWPFLLPFAMFSSAFVYCYVYKKQNYMKWIPVHNYHSITATIMAVCSLYFNDDTILNERVGILFTFAYFVVDLPDCVLEGDVGFVLHAILCLGLGYANYVRPMHRILRLNSMANICEFSSPFLHLAKKTRKPMHLVMFFVAFTCCRILWIPQILRKVYDYQGGVFFQRGDYAVPACLVFYALNLYWYYRIICIAVKTIRGDSETKKKKE